MEVLKGKHRMNKIIIWIIVFLLILTAGYYMFTSLNEVENTNTQQSEIENIPESEFSNLESSDEVFNEIDESLNYIE
jgi:flagellar basal body-associated protein FliL